MLHLEDLHIRKHILDGMFGLEKESLRVLEDGHFPIQGSPLRIVILLSGIFVRTKQKLIQKFMGRQRQRYRNCRNIIA